MDDVSQAEREARAGQNQILFREVNERIEALADSFRSATRKSPFACECSDLSCVEQVHMTIDEYEAVRAHATHFAVRPGHVLPDVEDVVSSFDEYDVVAKRRVAAELAMQADPRGGAAR